MKRKSTIILTCFAMLCVCAGLTGCGKETVDVTAGADIKVSGYDGHGIATISEGNWLSNTERTYGQGMSFAELAMLEEALYDAVEFSVSPSENLSNGDEVTLTIDVDNSALESYDFKLSGGEKKITVSGLDEVESFDPFANIAVNFSGMSPSGTASVNTSDSNIDIKLNYTLDKNSGLKNGDEVTLSISSSSGTDVEEYCLNNGKIPTATEKKFTVEGLATYAQTLADIPEDMKSKMLAQAEDAIKAKCVWDEYGTTGVLKSLEYLGDYYLTGKEGFDVSPQNKIYCLYKGTVEFNALKRHGDGKTKETGTASFYTCYLYNNIVLMPDGTCSVDLSNGQLADYSYETDYGYDNGWFPSFYKLHGKENLDSIFSDRVTSQIEKYNYESTVKE
ncbi:MAG: hypothetical protein HDT23_06370 [Ruminococcus sp.]|nr:hypothetical protein [Ruminococcus sp.]